MKPTHEKVGIFSVAGDDQHAEITRGRKIVESVDATKEEPSAFQYALKVAGRLKDHPQAVKHGPTLEAVRGLFDRIQLYGRTCYDHKAEVSRGQCIGIAFARLSEPQEVVDAAMTMLEDWNAHLAVAAVAAIEKGQGKVTRKGRKLTIILPEWWKE